MVMENGEIIGNKGFGRPVEQTMKLRGADILPPSKPGTAEMHITEECTLRRSDNGRGQASHLSAQRPGASHRLWQTSSAAGDRHAARVYCAGEVASGR